MAAGTWHFWEITDDDGELRWLGATRPKGRSDLDRATVWTLIPRTRVFVANWFISTAWATEESGLAFEDIEADRARAIVADVPDVSADDLARITHPEGRWDLQRATSHPALTVLGKRAETALRNRR